jgi:hypothetical protein
MQQWLLPEIESVAFELPGRSDRFGEPLLNDMHAITEDIFGQIKNELNDDYFFVGISMGSLIAYLLCHKIKANNLPLPKYLFLASRLSPDSYFDEPTIMNTSSEEFWNVVIKYDGVPQALVEHKELRELYEPILRADFEALEKLELKKVKIMWLGYPHMPTGARGSLALFEKLVAFAKKHNILLVNDNPYSFVLNDNPMSLLQIEGAKEVALELNSLSKTFNMAGWRVGMVLGNPEIIDAVLKVKSNMDSGMFYGIQKGAVAALNCDKSWFEDQNKIYRRRRELTEKLAEKLGCEVYKEGVGLFVWAKLPEGIESAEKFIDEILYEKHIFITPGTIFGSNGEGYIRFSLCVKEEKVQEAIDRF